MIRYAKEHAGLILLAPWALYWLLRTGFSHLVWCPRHKRAKPHIAISRCRWCGRRVRT